MTVPPDIRIGVTNSRGVKVVQRLDLNADTRLETVETDTLGLGGGRATLAPRLPEKRRYALQNVAVATAQASSTLMGLLSDGITSIYKNFNNIGVSTNHGTTVTIGKNFNTSSWSPDGLIETPNGEVLVSVKPPSGSTGEVWRSTGWNKTTGQATSWAKVLTCSGADVYCRGVWGFNAWGVAPSWSKRAGDIVICEYGPQTDTVANPQQAAIRAYRSTDDGVTWTEIFNWVTEKLSANDIRLHTHGIAYDPFSDLIFITAGDGGNVNQGHCALLYADPDTLDWQVIAGSSNTTSDWQATGIIPQENGLLLTPDGPPEDILLLPRRGVRSFGTLTSMIDVGPVGGGTLGYIGGNAWRNGGNEGPSVHSPMLLCNLHPTTPSAKPRLFASSDGVTVEQLYEHPTLVTGGAPGFLSVFGPTTDGKVIACLNLAGTSQVLTADLKYVPATAPVSRLWDGEATMDRALAVKQDISMSTGVMRLGYFTAEKTETITQVRVPCGNVAAAATPTLVRFGVYSVADDGALTLVASTANDTALLAVAGASSTKALQASFTKRAGFRYAVGVLVVTGATVPQITGAQRGIGPEMAVEPRLVASLGGQTDLPATIASGSLAASPLMPYVVLIP